MVAALTMMRKKRTNRHYERTRQRLDGFNVKLVLMRERTETATRVAGLALQDEVPSGPSRMVAELGHLNSQATPPVSFLKAFLRYQKRLETGTFGQPFLSYQKRLEAGTFGQPCTLKTNHFVVNLLKNQVHQYDICISPDDESRGFRRTIIGKLVSRHRQSDLDGCFPVYDGMKRLYTSVPLPFICRSFDVELNYQEDTIGQTPSSHKGIRLFKVVIEFVACRGLQLLDMYLAGGQEDEYQVAHEALNIILRETLIGRCCPFPKSVQLGRGLEIRLDFFQALRITHKGLLLNIDISPTVSIKPVPVIDYIEQLLDRVILDRPLCDDHHSKIKKALEGVIVKVTKGSDTCKKHCVFGLTEKAARELYVPDNDAKFMHYFQEKYGHNIVYTFLPCLDVGNEKRPIYLPMEACVIIKGQQLSRKQMSAVLEVSRPHPLQREHLILEAMNHYNEEPLAKEFGIKIETHFLSLNARVLPPPWLEFHGSGKTKNLLPEIGIWNMVCKRMFHGGRVSNWTCLNFSWDVTDKSINGFCHELAIMCQASGMDFSVNPVLPVLSAAPEHVELELKSCLQKVMSILEPKGRELDLLIVILPNKSGSLYGNLKRICETDIGVVSQCCLAKHVSNRRKRYLANLALKINVKMGGKNTVLKDALTKRLPCVGDVPTIIFGAHVMHSGKKSGPSIAAIVASQDWPEVTNYAALASVQFHCQGFIQHLFQDQYDYETGDGAGGMIVEHLVSFHRATGLKPQRIIFYRDAVSNEQLYQVMWQELIGIKKACSYLEPDYKPSLTYVVAQKHRHTRFFVDNEHSNFLDSGNILPGTVVDSDICHPNESGFYLCSHVGTQGTTQPVHYHIMWDENRFTADKFQCLTNYLCYTYARCTQSVSVVPPVYYARLMASRGRLYMESTTSGSAQVGGTSTAHPTSDEVKVGCLPAVKENVKRVMFYC